MTATARPSLAIGPRYSDDLDLRDFIRGGSKMNHPIRYSDDVWDLSGHPEVGNRNCSMKWSKFPDRFIPLLKDCFLLMGTPTLPLTDPERWPDPGGLSVRETGDESGWRTVLHSFNNISLPLRWYDVAAAHPAVDDPGDIAGFLRCVSPKNAKAKLMVLRRLHDLAPWHGHISPFGGRPGGHRNAKAALTRALDIDWAEVDSVTFNSTPPNPDWAAWLGVCLAFLDVAADDLIAHADWWHRTSTADDRDRGMAEIGPRDRSVINNPCPLPRPAWLPDGHDLLMRHGTTGLYWWTDRLYVALKYVIAAITGLRSAEMQALTPDCITTDADGRLQMSGLKIKGQDITNPPPKTWFITSDVARAVSLVNRLREALDVPKVTHPRLPGRPVLFTTRFSHNTHWGHDYDTRLDLLSAQEFDRMEQALTALAAGGVVRSVDSLSRVTHTEVRRSVMVVTVNRQHGLLAAAAVGGWRSVKQANMYAGPVPDQQISVGSVVSPMPFDDDELAAARAEQALAFVVGAADEPEALTGRAANRVLAVIENVPVLSQKNLKRELATAGLSGLSVGFLTGCAGPTPQAVCGGQGEVVERLCGLGCASNVLSPQQQARIEYQRRVALRRLGVTGRLWTAKYDGADELAAVTDLTDAELVEVLTDGWPHWLAEINLQALEAA